MHHVMATYGVNNHAGTEIVTLCFRCQQALVDWESFNSYNVLTGVPQGSVLGPLASYFYYLLMIFLTILTVLLNFLLIHCTLHDLMQ